MHKHLAKAPMASAEMAAPTAGFCTMDDLVADPFAPTSLLAAAFAPPRDAKRRRTIEPPPQPASPPPAAADANAPSSSCAPPAAPPEAARPQLAPEILAALQELRKPLRDSALSEESRAAKCERGGTPPIMPFPQHLMMPGDWFCSKCTFMNYADRKKCYKCNNKK